MILKFFSSEDRYTYIDTDKVLYIRLKLSRYRYLGDDYTHICHEFKCKYFTDGEYTKDFYYNKDRWFWRNELEDRIKEFDAMFQGFNKYETKEARGTFVDFRYIIYYRMNLLDGVTYNEDGSGACSLLINPDKKYYFGLTIEFLDFMHYLERAIPLSKL